MMQSPYYPPVSKPRRPKPERNATPGPTREGQPVTPMSPAPEPIAPSQRSAALELAGLGAFIGAIWGLTEGALIGGAVFGAIAAVMLPPVIFVVLNVIGWLIRITFYFAVGIGAHYLLILLGGGG